MDGALGVEEVVSPFLQSFWDLAAIDLQTRENAVSQLVKHLKEQKVPGNKNGFPGWSMDMVYTVTRLCRGICSSHDCARQGFSLALTYPFISFHVFLRCIVLFVS